MNHSIAFFVGCLTFVIMMLVKVPIKRGVNYLIENSTIDEERNYVYKRRMNFCVIIATFVVASMCYFYVGLLLEIDHFKWCCSLNAGAIAIALYAVYEQWFGDIQEE